jgi:hypothetical protein
MAAPISCDLCGQENAQVMQTNVENGDVIAVGLNCLPIFYLTAAAEMISMMPAANRLAYAAAAATAVNELTGLADAGAAATMAEAPAESVSYDDGGQEGAEAANVG